MKYNSDGLFYRIGEIYNDNNNMLLLNRYKNDQISNG